ncbi:hypothetical protein [Acinetobacter towneri]|uniref:hypothetical protein n=1 Tax=Acinetobacter towneri TaxID=202956 RepID=UPI001F60E395|nr:hypothetical protein [Acinetobacter towneri]
MYVINQRNWGLELYQQIGGYGSKYDGERYELQLCEKCFFYALATLKKERADEFIFDENFDPSTLDRFRLK